MPGRCVGVDGASLDSDREWWYSEYSTPQGYALEPPPGTPLVLTVDVSDMLSELATRKPVFSAPCSVAMYGPDDAIVLETVARALQQKHVAVSATGTVPAVQLFDRASDCYRRVSGPYSGFLLLCM